MLHGKSGDESVVTFSPPPFSPQLKVTHNQLVLLHGAFAAYFSGNHTAVEALVKEFHSKLEQMERRDPPAWLEELSGSQDHQ